MRTSSLRNLNNNMKAQFQFGEHIVKAIGELVHQLRKDGEEKFGLTQEQTKHAIKVALETLGKQAAKSLSN